MLALLLNETLAVNGAVLPLPSILTPTSLNEPDWLLFGEKQIGSPTFAQGSTTVIVPPVGLIELIETFENNPL